MYMDISKDKTIHERTGHSILLLAPCQVWHQGTSGHWSGRDGTHQATPESWSWKPRIVSQYHFWIEKCWIIKQVLPTKVQVNFHAAHEAPGVFPSPANSPEGVSMPLKLGKKLGRAVCQATAVLACSQVKHGHHQSLLMAIGVLTSEENLHSHHPTLFVLPIVAHTSRDWQSAQNN